MLFRMNADCTFDAMGIDDADEKILEYADFFGNSVRYEGWSTKELANAIAGKLEEDDGVEVGTPQNYQFTNRFVSVSFILG